MTAGEAVRAVAATTDSLKLVEALSVERGALQEALLSTQPIRADLGAMAARNEALADRLLQSLRAAGVPGDAVMASRDILRNARARVAEAASHPLAQRDRRLVTTATSGLYEQLYAVDGLAAVSERWAGQAIPEVGALVAMGILSVEMRGAAGWRSSTLSGWVGGRELTLAELDDARDMTNKIQFAWTRLERQLLILGSPPELAVAVAAMRDGFMRDAEPRYRALLAMARQDQSPPMSLPEWRRWTVETLPGALLARDAAMTAAANLGAELASQAQRNMAIAGLATLGVLALGAAAFLVLLRRVVLPMQRMTAAVTKLASGDVGAVMPECGRRDEIGAMAAAIEVFRGNARELQRTNLRFDAALSNMSQGLTMYDSDERLVVANARLCDVVGVPQGAIRVGMTFREVIAVCVAAGQFPGRTVDSVYRERRGFSAAGAPGAAFEEQRGDRILATTSRPMQGGGWLFTLEDVTERRIAESRIAHMAHHDALTELPNRVLLRNRLEDALGRSRRAGGFALLCLDLDHFKAVNDTLGHAVGDAVLRGVADRLRDALRDTDTPARVGGDEFVVLQASLEDASDATALAKRLIDALSAPYLIDGQQVEIGVSIGIALASSDGADPETLMKNADLALYRAKADGRSTYRFFEPEMDALSRERRLMEADLRRAVAAGELELHYQPLMDLRTRQPICFEALLRWRHPTRGLVPPGDFIPLAEETGLIGPIGEWVLHRACQEAATWPGDIKVAVNLSALQFKAGLDLADTVVAALDATGLDARRLELEITESAMLHETDGTMATLHRIRELGATIAMDDFGTGFSSLSHLRRFPFDKVKIDKSFIQGLGHGDDCAAIVQTVMRLCAALGITVTAEGIETEAQLTWLAAEGLIEAQGFHFSRPLPPSELPHLIARWKAAVAKVPALAWTH